MAKLFVVVLCAVFVFSSPVYAAEAASFRPPSVPLVVCDPYFSIWSAADTLNEDVTRHWTGQPHPLTSLVRIDGKTYRLMGNEPKKLPALKQTKLEVLPTRTIYHFEGSGIAVSMTFMQPALPDDIDLMSRPIVFLTWSCTATDGNTTRFPFTWMQVWNWWWITGNKRRFGL